MPTYKLEILIKAKQKALNWNVTGLMGVLCCVSFYRLKSVFIAWGSEASPRDGRSHAMPFLRGPHDKCQLPKLLCRDAATSTVWSSVIMNVVGGVHCQPLLLATMLSSSSQILFIINIKKPHTLFIYFIYKSYLKV